MGILPMSRRAILALPLVSTGETPVPLPDFTLTRGLGFVDNHPFIAIVAEYCCKFEQSYWSRFDATRKKDK